MNKCRAEGVNLFMSVGRIYIYDVCNIVTFNDLLIKLEEFKRYNQTMLDYLEESGRNYTIVGMRDGNS